MSETEVITRSSVPTERLKDKKLEDGVTGTRYFKTDIVWLNAIGFILLHLLAAYAAFLYIFQVSLKTQLYGFFCYSLAAQGILMGAHRYYSHRAYKATFPLRLLLILCQTITGQNCMWIWVRDHRLHHKYADTEADPHDASRGLFFSHMGWLMMRKLPEVIEKGRTIDISDLERDSLVMFQKKYYYPMYIICNLALVMVPIIGWGETAWNSFMVTWILRTVVMYNVTWSVNSFAHHFGTKPYDKTIRPVELPTLSIFTFGEGWHNYHHAFPSDYKASEFGMPYNFTTFLIHFFEKIGWVYDLKEVSEKVVVNKMLKLGDGSRTYGSHNPLPSSE